MSFMAFFTRALVFCHCCVPSRLSTGFTPSDGAILLHQVEARQRDVEPRALGIFQDHELGGCAVLLRNFLQSLVLADAVLDVDHVVADCEVAKVGEKGGDLRLLRCCGCGRRDIGLVEQIARAKEHEVCLGQHDAFRHVGLDDGGGGNLFAKSSSTHRRRLRPGLGVRLPMRNDRLYSLKTSASRSTSPSAGDGEDDVLAVLRGAGQLLRRRRQSSRESAWWAATGR